MNFDPTRSSLLERIRNPNDRDAWADVYKIYSPLMRALAKRNGVSADDADDLVHEGFLRLRDKIPEGRYQPQEGKFRAWLTTVMTNLVKNWKVKQARRHNRERAAEEPIVEGPKHQLDRDCRKLILDLALDKVRKATKPKTWACFEGFYLRGLSAKDVGAEVGLEPGAVHQNTHRVLQAVREMCAEFGEDFTEG
jgi:RNA polymerase sigma-70 factor (ECF subfamily)